MESRAENTFGMGVELTAVRRARTSDSPYWVLAILVISVALRVGLALKGGEYFWTDESRYCVSQSAAEALTHGQVREGVDLLFRTSDHAFFKIVGVLPALVEVATRQHPAIPAIFYGLFSVLNLYLLGRLVRRHGGSAGAATWVVFVGALANSFFYYARHVFPYDLALTFFLLALWVGLSGGGWRAFSAGFLAALGFMTYNGYWLMGGATLGLVTFIPYRGIGYSLQRAAVALAGLFLPIAGFLSMGRWFGHDLVHDYLEFSRTAVTGDFDIAWRLPWQFFWQAEHGLLLLLAVALLCAFAAVWKRQAPGYLLAALAVFFACYAASVGMSDVVHRFTVLGRHARPLLLPLVVIGGWALNAVAARYGRTAAMNVACLLVLQAAFNFSEPWRQVFPTAFEAESQREMEAREAKDLRVYRYLEGGFTEQIPDYAFTVIRRTRHPLEFRPYSYDGYNEELRTRYGRQDISLRLVRMEPDPRAVGELGEFAPYPGPLRIEFGMAALLAAVPQPLVSTGRRGYGDMLYLQSDDNGATIRLAVDHWGGGAYSSEPLHVDWSKRHEVVVSFGALYPGPDHPIYRAHPEWQQLRDCIYVEFDGRELVFKRLDGYTVPRETLEFFHNYIGFTSAGQRFLGSYWSVKAVEPSEMLKRVGSRVR